MRILHAAREVFSERGYDGATFQAIAVRADLTRPAINHYFPSKRALYREVADHANELFIVAGIERARGESGTVDRLGTFISVGREAEHENSSMYAFLVASVVEARRHPELARPESDPVRISREFLTWSANEAIGRGELPADTDVATLVEAFLVVLGGVGLYAGYMRGDRPMETITSSLQQLLGGQLWRSAT